MSIRVYRLLNAVLILSLFAGSAWAYSRLAEPIPVHFDARGQPDGWQGVSVTSWFVLPATAAVLSLVLHAASAYGARRPRMWNVPDKRRFLALTPAEQAPIIARMQRFMAILACAAAAMLGAVQLSLFAWSTGDAARLLAGTHAALLALVAGVSLAALHTRRAVKQMLRELESAAG